MRILIKSLLLLMLISLCVASISRPIFANRKVRQVAKKYYCPPCASPCDDQVFDKPGICPVCGMTLVDKEGLDRIIAENKAAEKSIPTVAILIFNSVQIIDYSGPYEVFGEAGFKVFTVAEKADPITTVFGQKVTPTYSFETSPKPDILLIPGGGVRGSQDDPMVIKWIQDTAKDAKYVMSVCNGAFILAQTGLLDGLSATTTDHNIPRLAQAFPKVKVVDDQRYTDNGKILTTAGLSSGIDGALHLVAKIRGTGQAEATALGMEYRWEPNSTFARAALADKLMPQIFGTDLKGSLESTEGDLNQWEIRFTVTEPASAAEIMDRITKRVTSDPYGSGKVKWMPENSSHASGSLNTEKSWQFTDERGRSWAATTKLKSGSNRTNTLTIKVAREQKTAAETK